MSKSKQIVLSVCLIVAAAFYRPLDFWAVNAWELHSPVKLLLIGLGVALAGVITFSLAVRLGIKPLVSGLAIGSVLMVFMRWQSLVGTTGFLAVCLILVLSWLLQRVGNSIFLEWVAIMFLVAFGLVPIVQLVAAHVRDSEPFTVVQFPTPEPAVASGLVEDVVVLIVDTYPNLQIADNWLGHDTEFLVKELSEQGFTVPPSSWSRHTFTALSVSSILQLESVIEAGPTPAWGNRSSLWHMARGDNLVSQTLQSAGFTYTHVESGWEGTVCGPQVDRCVRAPWVDEQVWELMSPTIARGWLANRYHTVTGTFNAADALGRELPDLGSNGSHDYVFAHFLMPHDPLLVDDACTMRSYVDGEQLDIAERRSAFSEQISCVDSLLISVIGTIDRRTAVMITGDHGSGIGGQVGSEPSEWSDSDIAERFGVLLGYRVPSGCNTPSLPDPTVTMATILSCAVGQTFTTSAPEYLIGDEDPEPVAPERMADIQARVLAGSLPPEDD